MVVSRTNRSRISAQSQRRTGHPTVSGREHANAVACARISGGKLPRSSRPRPLPHALRLVPPPTPLLHRLPCAPDAASHLTVDPIRVRLTRQHHSRTKHFPLRAVAPRHNGPKALTI